MNLRRARVWLFALAAQLLVVTLGLALEPGKDGYFHTGDGVRVKKVAFISANVYAIRHDMKVLPPTKSKRAVIDTDCDKRFVWRMLRDVDSEKIQNAFREGYAMNGYRDDAKIRQFVSGFRGELKEGSGILIVYNAAAKATTLTVQGASVTVPGVDFMRATWSLWFGQIDQPALGDSLIAKL